MTVNPDDVLWRYLELRQRLATAPAQNLIAETGLIFARSCPTCGTGAEARTIVSRGDGGRRTTAYRCGSCQGSWPTEVGFLARNEVRGFRRRGGIEGPLSELGTYSVALSSLDAAHQRIYLQLYLYEGVGSYRDVAAAANSRWPRMKPARGPAQWTEWTVRTIVGESRRQISRRISMAAS